MSENPAGTAVPSTTPETTWEDSVDARLAHLGTYEPGWLDGEGDRISPEARSRARELALLIPGVSIFANPDSGVNLEWGHDGPIFWSAAVSATGPFDVHGIDVYAVRARQPVRVFAAELPDAASALEFVTASELEFTEL